MASLSSAPVDLAKLKSSGTLNNLSVPTSWYAALPQAWAAAVKDVLVDLRHEGLDEMWVAVHLLGGMSSGFALRGESLEHDENVTSLKTASSPPTRPAVAD